MASFAQYEIWAQNGDRWELVASFLDLQVASAVASKRSSHVRLVHAQYKHGKLLKQELLADVGSTRRGP